MTNHDIEVVKTKLRSLSLAELSSALGQDLVSTLADLGEGITKRFLIDAIVKIRGSGIFYSSIIRNHFCALANIDPIARWNSSRKCIELLSHFGLSGSFLPAQSKRRDISTKAVPNFVLHDYQDHVKKEVSNFLLSEQAKNRLMVQLPTGAGKTSLAMESIYDFFRINRNCKSVTWMAHTDELCEQAVESFIRGWQEKGSFEVKIIRLWGGRANSLFNELQDDVPTFIVSSFQSINSMLSTRNDEVMQAFLTIKQQTNLLVVDEAHMTLAETYKDSIEMLSGKDCKVVGLTATPGRHGVGGDDAETRELARFYEGNLVNMNEFCGSLTPVQFLQHKEILSTVEQRRLLTDFNVDLTSTDMQRISQAMAISDQTLKKVGENAKRNLLIVDQIQKILEIEKRKKVLVFASSKDNSDLLSAMLLLRDIEAISITGETDFSHRVNTVRRFKENEFKVLINFNVFTTGFDDPGIDCVLIARPTFSVVLYSQMIGRGLRGRKNGGTKDCLVVDLIDNVENQPNLDIASDYFHNQWFQ